MRATELAAAALLCLMTGLVILQVFFRYVLNSPLTWSEELARLCMIWLAFLGSAVALRQGKHIRLEGMEGLVPAALRTWLPRLLDASVLGLCVLLAVESAKLAARTHHQRLAALQIPVSYMYGAVFVGALLMVAYQAAALCRPGARKAEGAGRERKP